MKLEPKEQQPIGERIQEQMIDCCGAPPRTVKLRYRQYQQTADGERLRDALRRREISCCDAGKLIGLTCPEMSGLCSGRYNLSREQWEWLMEVIEKMPR